MTRPDTNIRSETVIEAAEAIGFALAAMKMMLSPSGASREVFDEAMQRLEDANQSLLEILK